MVSEAMRPPRAARQSLQPCNPAPREGLGRPFGFRIRSRHLGFDRARRRTRSIQLDVVDPQVEGDVAVEAELQARDMLEISAGQKRIAVALLLEARKWHLDPGPLRG